MAMAKSKKQCFICNKEKTTYLCRGCSSDFCYDHLSEHRQTLGKQLDEIECDHDQLQQTIFEQKQNPQNYSLMEQINQWEQNSIDKIKQTAEECREIMIQYMIQTKNKFIQLTEQLKRIRQENEFNEIDLNHLKKKLTQLTQELTQPSKISVQQDSSSSFIDKISVISSPVLEQSKWKQYAITMAGGFRKGDKLNQLCHPCGIFIDNDKTIYIADCWNHRIVQWKSGKNKGQVIAGGNGRGNKNDELNLPRDIIVDKQNNSLIIADYGNRRVIRWLSQNNTNQQILMSDIYCYGLTMNRNGSIYVSDCKKNEVRQWKEGETNGTIVAGGNGEGNHRNQLNYPTYIFIDVDDSLYVSDSKNHRVMKWRKDAREGIVVAGGNGQGNSLTQLSNPCGVIVNHLGQIYVADWGNARVMCWSEGISEGSIVVGRNGEGKQSNQLYFPVCLSFDVEVNLYISDWGNNRIQKFEIDFD